MSRKPKTGATTEPTFDEAVGKRIKLGIDAAGITPTILAAQLTALGRFGEVKTQRINGWINEGKKPISWDLVGAIAKQLQVPVDWLITGDTTYVPRFMVERILAVYPEWVQREPVFAHIRIE